MSKVLLYGDVSPNVIDGSSIWLVSMATVLSEVFEEVHLLLKAHPTNEVLLSSIASLDNLETHLPHNLEVGQDLSPDQAKAELEQLDNGLDCDCVVVRGINACNSVSSSGRLAPKTWSYVTELPFPPDKISANNLNRLNRIVNKTFRMFAQTEGARSYLESIVPSAAGKVDLLLPMIPDVDASKAIHAFNAEDPLKIVYAGKFAKEWKTLELLELPGQLKKRGINAQLTVIGDKYNKNRTDPGWLNEMKSQLRSVSVDPLSGVKWLGALPRGKSIAEIAKADIGIGWRDAELDSSLEISTKALEYLSVGTPAILNDTEDHRALLGDDYPLLIGSTASVEDLADLVAKTIDQIADLSRKVPVVASDYYFSSAVLRLKALFNKHRVLSSAKGLKESKTRNLLIASHDFKFMGELMEFLQKDNDIDVRQDSWESLHKHNAAVSHQHLEWADTILCEWAGPNLVWYSQHKLPHQKLICRLHRFELDNNAPWLQNVNWENVDKMIFVSELYRRLALEKLPITWNDTAVIPNSVDMLDFDRPKTAQARFTLGFIGMVPFHKRPDRALDLLEKLLTHDDRYVLRFKGRMPWEYSYEWQKPIQKQLYLEFFARIASNDLLKKHVIFDHFSPDVSNWFRGVGFILSPSEVESFHMAPAEGMASRSVPLFWQRPGVDEIFGERFVDSSVDAMVKKILDCQDPSYFRNLGEEARSSVARWDPVILMELWKREICEGLR